MGLKSPGQVESRRGGGKGNLLGTTARNGRKGKRREEERGAAQKLASSSSSSFHFFFFFGKACSFGTRVGGELTEPVFSPRVAFWMVGWVWGEGRKAHSRRWAAVGTVLPPPLLMHVR